MSFQSNSPHNVIECHANINVQQPEKSTFNAENTSLAMYYRRDPYGHLPRRDEMRHERVVYAERVVEHEAVVLGVVHALLRAHVAE